MQTLSQTASDPSERVWSFDVIRDNRISDRCLRKWIVAGRFPKPDGNMAGRNFWLRTTYSRWQAEVLAGRYSQQRRPGSASVAA